jgi:hypothetical protein
MVGCLAFTKLKRKPISQYCIFRSYYFIFVVQESTLCKAKRFSLDRQQSWNKAMGFWQTPIPPTPATDLSGKTVLVTGGTAGLGLETSLQLLRLKAGTLILGVRNASKGEAVKRQLLADDEARRVNRNATIKILPLDLADERSVVEFGKRVLEEEKRLDILLLNAGMNLIHFEKSTSGHEM